MMFLSNEVEKKEKRKKNLLHFAMNFQNLVDNGLFGQEIVFLSADRISNFGSNIYPCY